MSVFLLKIAIPEINQSLPKPQQRLEPITNPSANQHIT